MPLGCLGFGYMVASGPMLIERRQSGVAYKRRLSRGSRGWGEWVGGVEAELCENRFYGSGCSFIGSTGTRIYL